MNRNVFFLSCTAAGLVLGLSAGGAHAQVRSISAAPNNAAANAAASRAPSAGTIGSPSPAGLSSRFPAGLTSGSGPAAAADPRVGVNATTNPAVATNLSRGGTPLAGGAVAGSVPAASSMAATPGGAANAGDAAALAPTGPAAFAAGAVIGPTAVMGAGTNVPTARQGTSGGPGPWTAVEVASSFIFADANRDGELTRAEATRLTIMPNAFETMDRNGDGVVTRSEYDDGVR